MKRSRALLFLIPALLLAGLLVYSLTRAAMILIPQQREQDAFAELKRSALAEAGAAPRATEPPSPSAAPQGGPAPTREPVPTQPSAPSPQPGAPRDSGEPPEETELDERAAAVGDPLSELDDNGLPRAYMEGQPDGSPANANASSQPRTGDDTRLDLYLSLAIASAAGLFALALGYRRASRK